ncbi:hypothetical protein LRH25_07450 [Ideonella azotifigens]|uniref:Uncharacterized protein n=1 Tax=Ideonella azotifigens TaxID=513160 RepID=A0ABN1JR96_9BURK|nr:hypothetical protein [Ideonella azotifigens]MCD2340176.1 hypothetical protein [Ideonella azotifigens]
MNTQATTRLFSAVASLAVTFVLLTSVLGIAGHEHAAAQGLLATGVQVSQLA